VESLLCATTLASSVVAEIREVISAAVAIVIGGGCQLL